MPGPEKIKNEIVKNKRSDKKMDKDNKIPFEEIIENDLCKECCKECQLVECPLREK